MGRTLIQVAQSAADEMGIARPTALVGSMDAQALQLLALAQREGIELSAREGSDGGWPQLRREHTFNTANGTPDYAFPSDLQYFINSTAWDRSQKWPLRGPVSPQEWQVVKSGTIGSVGPRTRFRLMAGRLYLDPTPTSVRAAVLEYYSNAWCESSGGTAQARWASDSDVPRLPDEAFVLGLIWRFRKAKGLEYQEDFNTYDDFVQKEIGRATMAPVLSLVPSCDGVHLIDELNIPDSGFGGL